MRELSVFIDESGDFGAYSPHSPYYIVSMAFHDQKNEISEAVDKLNKELVYLGLDSLCIHTGPIIRKEEIYSNMHIMERRRIFNKMVAFISQINIRYKSFVVEKQHTVDTVDMIGKLSKQISQFIRDHYEEFLEFDAVKIYYDNGQVEMSKMLSSVFNTILPNPVFRKVMPKDYKLFQVADLLCTMEVISLKLERGKLSNSETLFFGNARDFKKNYIKKIRLKEWI